MVLGAVYTLRGHLEWGMPLAQIAVNILMYGLIMAMAGYDSDDNLSLAGLTQETCEIDVTTISSDDEPFDPGANYRMLLEEARKISSYFFQVSNFDDHIFAMSHGSMASPTQSGFAEQSSNSGIINGKQFAAFLCRFQLKAMFVSASNLGAKVIFLSMSRTVDSEKKGRA